ncbi:MAG: hypothetical protein U1C97_03720, partial [Candidatus Gracilibacteria bacterium]|nr:hypothetical protein [Candidatus Gracilibacteria bacterium]
HEWAEEVLDSLFSPPDLVAKFVVTGIREEIEKLYVFPVQHGSYHHADIAEFAKRNGEIFLAAGMIEKGDRRGRACSVRYGSQSSEIHLGYDRPSGRTEQENLLSRVRESVGRVLSLEFL